MQSFFGSSVKMEYFTKMKVRLIALLLVCCNFSVFAQDVPIFTQYFANPYIYNPAYAGLEGRPAFSLSNRRQWVGIEDAPVTYNFTFHTPVVAGFNIGVNLTQDNYGIFQSNTALLTFGYNINLGFNQYLAFGISGGIGNQQIDPTGLNLSDPALSNVLDQNLFLDGNAGLAYHIANFNIGISLPRIFNTRIYPTTDFDTGDLDLIRNWIVTADYMIYFGADQYAFQPYALYRSYTGYDTQYEAGGIFHIKNILWVGGGYRQDFGVMGLIGVTIDGYFSAGYSYETPISGNNGGVNQTSHELQLTFAIGKRNKRSQNYATFVASEKPVKQVPVIKVIREEPVDSIATEPPDIIPVVIPPDTIYTAPADTIVAVPVDTIVVPIPVPIDTVVLVEDDLGEGPKVIARKGYHPFEMPSGNYVVVAAFGEFKNAVRFNDNLLTQGYDSDFGFNTDKKLFYVYLFKSDDSDSTKIKRNELRQDPEFPKAWYLLIK